MVLTPAQSNEWNRSFQPENRKKRKNRLEEKRVAVAANAATKHIDTSSSSLNVTHIGANK